MKAYKIISLLCWIGLINSCKKISPGCQVLLGQYEWLLSSNKNGTQGQTNTPDRFAIVITERHVNFYKNGQCLFTEPIYKSRCFEDHPDQVWYGNQKTYKIINISNGSFTINDFPYYGSVNYFMK